MNRRALLGAALGAGLAGKTMAQAEIALNIANNTVTPRYKELFNAGLIVREYVPGRIWLAPTRRRPQVTAQSSFRGSAR